MMPAVCCAPHAATSLVHANAAPPSQTVAIAFRSPATAIACTPSPVGPCRPIFHEF